MGGAAALEVLLHGGHGFVEHLQLVGIEARRVGDLRAQGAHRILGIADGELLHEEGRQLLGPDVSTAAASGSARDASVTSRAEEAAGSSASTSSMLWAIAACACSCHCVCASASACRSARSGRRAASVSS